MLTKGAIGNLVNRYRAVLKKCHLMNTFGSLAVAAMLVAGGVVSASAADNNDLKPVNGALTLYYDGSLYGDTSLDIKVNEDKSVTANVQDKTAGYGVLTNYHDNDAISDIIITGSTFKNNTQENGPWTQGGTVSLWDSGYAGTDSVKKEINQTTFESNTAAGVGGAVAIFKGADYDVAGTTNFNEVTFTQNSGSIGGAVLAEAENLIFNGGSFKRNDAAGRGGAIYLTKGNFNALGNRGSAESTLTIDGTTFEYNTSKAEGGAIYAFMPSDVTIQNSVFTGNEGTVGGAVSLWSDNLNAEELAASSGSGDITYTFDNVKFIGNKADREGADLGKGGAVAFMPFENLHNATVNADLSNVTFTENSSNGTGGAIQVESTNLILNGSTFTGNTAGTKGGAIYIDELSSTELSGDNLLENNIAAGDANDVHNKGELTVADGTTLMNSG